MTYGFHERKAHHSPVEKACRPFRITILIGIEPLFPPSQTNRFIPHVLVANFHRNLRTNKSPNRHLSLRLAHRALLNKPYRKKMCPDV